MQWLKDGLSIDETKISALIVAFYISLAFAMFQVYTIGDISANLLMLLAYELAAFTGIKIVEGVTTPKVKPTQVEQTHDTPHLP
jgi:hypothetical protein